MNTTSPHGHATLALIGARTSVAHFDASAEIDAGTVAALIHHACQAPSSYNLQNWRFVAVKSAARKSALRELAYGQPQVSDAAVTFIVVGTLDGHEHIRASMQAFRDAGHLDDAGLDEWVSDTRGSMDGDPARQRDEAIRSGSLAAMTLMIAAQAMGWASAPLGGFDAEALSAEFGLQSSELPVMLVAVGRAAAGNWPRKERRATQDVLQIV
ncbi:nitroreductase family protein [Burkholderia sp. LMU1-1-1.1]|uniref:nitroreductase family protein n=1 Tax=Burkholderia sp. LMU1-1-1.1 TaxID=3135266 RepID=UPI003412C700